LGIYYILHEHTSIQCTLHDSADKTNVYRRKIYMYLTRKFGGGEKTGSKRKSFLLH